MASPTPPPENPNPNPNSNPKKTYHIGGLKVEFPYRPYGTQMAFMGRVISTLDRAQRDGHCHALLESPTGTGKSLSLLCSTLAWQQNFAVKAQPKPDPKSISDPLGHGGGFVPEELEPSGKLASEAVQPATGKGKKKKKIPQIFYASRTHSQISQVIREYRKTSYRVPMAVLGSKKHYCTNPNVRGKDNVDELCKQLLNTKDPRCPEFKNYLGVKCHPTLKKGGCHEVHDIEDLVKVGQVVKGCPYYAARSMAVEANLVFCPYSYVVNPVIRGAMDLDIKGSILVLDEAHNMEDIARDAGSVDVEESTLLGLRNELEVLCETDEMYAVLYEMTQDLLSWIDHRRNTVVRRDFQLYAACWTGDKAMRELEEANISQLSFPSLLGCVTAAIKAATDTEREAEPHLTGMAVLTLEGLFSSLTYFFSRNGSHICDYQLAIRKHVKKEAGKADDDWTFTFSLWCLNPAVVFKDIAEISLSVILTSGTLSPMDSFSSELGVEFGTNFEAPHVIDIESQVWPAIISRGPSNLPLNASYKTSHGYDFQDALGKSLEDIFKVVPGGCLVFFPSYNLMEKLKKRWCETGQWYQLNSNKSLFMEPRGGRLDDFESVLNSYYDAIHGARKPLSGRKKRAKKLNVSNQCSDDTNTGAALFAVCRGKVSEGIDFSDDNARVVIVVGIPFPNIHDIQVDLKRKYNDAYKSSKNLQSGSEWYCQQAFRALNQAAGRCIRHKSDYGAIIFLDERYREARNRVYLSKWLRNSIRQYDNVELSLEGLKSFFSNAKELLGMDWVTAVEDSENISENVHSIDRSKGSTRKQNHKLNKSDNCGQKSLPLEQWSASFLSNRTQDAEQQASGQFHEDADKSEEVFNLCSPENESSKRIRTSIQDEHMDGNYPQALSKTFSLEEPEVSIVRETPIKDSYTATASPWSCLKDEAMSGILNELSSGPHSLTTSHKSFSKFQYLNVATPQKNAAITTSSSILEMESSLNQSVNSCCQKRRKPVYSHAVHHFEEECDAVDANASDCTKFMENSVSYGRRIDFAVESNHPKEKSKSTITHLPSVANSVSSTNPVMDKKLYICCPLCDNALGLPENYQYVVCYLTTTSKTHVGSLYRNILKSHHVNTSEDISILITDTSSVHQKIFSRNLDGVSNRGIWCEKDGCVFETIFCPFCITRDNCLGVQVMATDASNLHLLNKILFFTDQIKIKNPGDSKSSRDEVNLSYKDPLPCPSSRLKLNSIESFSYNVQESSTGWITTKSKIRN